MEDLPRTRDASLAFYRAFLADAARRGPGVLWKAKRWLARNDLFYLMVVVLNRPDLDHPWLFDRCREVAENPNGYLDLWAREHYKMLRLDEPVPTPSGWRRHGDLRPRDWVFGPDGEPTRVVATTPVFHDGEAFEIAFDDGSKIQAGAEHLWTVERISRRRVGAGRVGRETVTLSTREISSAQGRSGTRIAIPVAAPIRMPTAILPIPPYTLGAWLGDGHAADGRITCGDPEVFEAIRAEGFDLSHDHRDSPDAQTFTVYGLRPMLRALDLIDNKSAPLPMDYLRGSIAQRLELLRGLMDSDGHVNTRGTATFVNKNNALAALVFDLAAGLGMKPVKRAYDADHGRFYQVSFQTRADMAPFRIARKVARCMDTDKARRRFIVSVTPIAPTPMSCIQVERPDGLYLVGRGMVTTHNSTIITFALSLQDIIASHGDEPEPRYDGREVTIGIFSFNRPAAKAFLRQIKYEFETNETLLSLFPDVLWQKPQKQSPKWSEDDGIIVKRKANPKEATVEAYGVIDGMPTGKHYLIRVYDDLITKEAVTSPDMIQKVTTAWELSDNLGTEGGVYRIIGTRYALFDTYATMMERGVPHRTKPCTSDGSEDWSKSVLRSAEFLAAKRNLQGPYTFGAQMLLNPTADKAQGFKTEWLRYWPASSFHNLNIVILVDPASKKKKTSDYTTMWVIGLGGDLKYYVIDVIRDRLNLVDRAKSLFSLHRKYRPLRVGYEQYGLQADIEHMNFVMGLENYRFDITPLGGTLAKEDRIKTLVPLFEQKRVLLPATGIIRHNYEGHAQNLIKIFIEEEYTPFPVLMHDDMLDCMARLTDPELALSFPEPRDDDAEPRWMKELVATDREMGDDLAAL